MKISFCQRSDKGVLRSNNEDAFASADSAEAKVFIIADGLGGLAFGEVASAVAVQAVKDVFSSVAEPFDGRWLCTAFQSANDSIFLKNSHSTPIERMATTLTVSQFYGEELIIGHVGDCRMYRVRNHRLEQLTRDHSIGPNILTRTIGTDARAEPDIVHSAVEKGDRYLQCSDGLYHMLTAQDILRLLDEFAEDICDRFICLANKKGGFDNITIQVVCIEAI